jgi:hypothetical protein
LIKVDAVWVQITGAPGILLNKGFINTAPVIVRQVAKNMLLLIYVSRPTIHTGKLNGLLKIKTSQRGF